jgi:hypothetical protein
VSRQVTSPRDKPVLDERTFQQLLAAAYALQKQNDLLPAKEAKVDCVRTLSDRQIAGCEARSEMVPMTPQTVTGPVTGEVSAEDVLEPTGSESARFVPPPDSHRVAAKRFLLTDELFWKVATVATVAAVSALLLGASVHRFSPLPTGMSLPSEAVQKPMPFQTTKRIMKLPTPTSLGGTNTPATELTAARKAQTGTRATAVSDLPPASGVSLATTRTMIVRSHRLRSAHSREDIIAEDTVIRYGTGSLPPSLPAQKKP